MPAKFLAIVALVAYPALAELVPGRYIVELSSEPVAERVVREAGKQSARQAMRGAAVASHRLRIREEQSALRGRMGAGVTVVGSIDTVGNALFVRVPDDRAAALAALPGVKRVRQVRIFKMVLDRAVVVDRVTEAWDRVGLDRAGEGVRIAIIDSGIDSAHPGLSAASMKAPDGFPKFSSEADRQFTSNKVIVARSYVNMLRSADPDQTARDRVGHGTALAMISAGVRTAAPLATITGVAPKAYLGNYKVFGSPGVNDGATDDAILKAIDDAVADGMDIINLSLGSDIAPRLDEDPTVAAVERAVRAGVIVVVASGNNGPDMGTVSSPATAPSSIAVGATRNDRSLGVTVQAEGFPPFRALAAAGQSAREPVSAPAADVAALDQTGQACEALPAASLTGRIGLILRGNCTFETKLNNAQQAGAVGALVYAAQDSPSPIVMGIGSATLPAEMIGHADGVALKERIAAGAEVSVALRFTVGAIPQEFNRLAGFSGIGPNVDAGVKPDLVAVGTDVYMATQSFDARGDMFSADGYTTQNGTSFSAPLVAGAAALLKSARPGLSVEQYRSLLVNTATAVDGVNGAPSSVQQTGTGQLDLAAALNATATVSPSSLQWGAGGPDPRLNERLRITNIGTAADTFSVTVVPREGSHSPVAGGALTLAAGASGEVPIRLEGGGLGAGAHEGFLLISGTASGTVLRVPYWYGSTSAEPAAIPLISVSAGGRRGGLLRNAVLFRVTDAAGIPIRDVVPEGIVVEGAGSVESITSRDSESPGLFSMTVRLGPAAGLNRFRIRAGTKTLDLTLAGQ
jgi:subtilisin family serine protease